MTQAQNTSEQLGWLLDSLVSRVANVSQALVLSRDGLVVAKSRGMSQEQADHLSALAAGMHSLAAAPASRSAAARCGRPSSRWNRRSCS